MVGEVERERVKHAYSSTVRALTWTLIRPEQAGSDGTGNSQGIG